MQTGHRCISRVRSCFGISLFTLGIAYQRSPRDPLVNATQCELDAALMAELGVNVIRGIPNARNARNAQGIADRE